MKLGAEFEYWIVDEEGRLRSAEALSSKFEFAEQEFVEPLFEVKTEPHETLEDLREEAVHNLEEAVDTADELGLQLVPLGTPLNSGSIEAIGSERGSIQQRIIGDDMEYARRVAGTHFHFEQENPVKQLNTLTALDPALALATSSRFCMGSRIGENARNHVYRNRCYRKFPRHGQLWDYTDSMEEWRERIQQRFQEFRQKALEKGIDPDAFDRHFSPDDTIWTPVRLRESFGTVEWRAPDSGLTSEVLGLLEQVKQVMEQQPELPDFDRLKRLSDLSMQQGVGNTEVREYLEELGLETDSFSRPQQDHSRDTVSRSKARKLRSDTAKKFRKDLEEL